MWRSIFGVGLLFVTFGMARGDVVGQFPANGATGVCADTPLRLSFSAAPTLGRSGKIQIFDAADNSVVESIDVSSPTGFKSIGGIANFKYYPVIITGNEAAIYLKNGELANGKSYYVTVDAGVFEGVGGISWKFSTKEKGPAGGASRLIVAADGTGDFCTVQGALDFVPEGNSSPVVIFIRKGTYNEIVAFTNKNAITLLGEDRKQTIIAYPNNANFNNGGGNPFATTASAQAVLIRGAVGRFIMGLFIAHRVNDLTIANLTLHNTTPHGGSQAEAIILNGTTHARAIVTDVDLYSFQDTLQINGQAYISDSYIEGDVDFMWGTGPCFFENCHATMVRSKAYYTQIRNPASNHGYVYVHSTFDGSAGVVDGFISRIAPTRFGASEVVLIDCAMNDAVGGPAWKFDDKGDSSHVNFAEYNSHKADGSAVDVSKRLATSKQLTQPADADVIANYSKPSFVLGNDWSPALAPMITTQPAAQGTLSVGAIGIPAPSFQWEKNGREIEGATKASFESSGPGKYSVVVGNSAGKVTSESVER